MSNINPYNAPAAVSDLIPSAATDIFEFGKWDSRATRAWIIAFRLLGLGFATTLFGLALVWLGYLGVGSICAIGLGLLVLLIGNAMLATVNGKQKMPLLFAALLQVVAMVGAAGYMQASMNGQVPNGFMKLFGASVFAGLLFSQAIVAIILRVWSRTQDMSVATHACEVAIGSFAVSAAICSLMSLKFVPIDSHEYLAKIIVICAVIGLCSLLVTIVNAELSIRSQRGGDHHHENEKGL